MPFKHWVKAAKPSGVATPRHTRAYARVKFAGARVKMKAKVKDQLLACVITSFMRTWSKQTGKTERIVFVAENGLMPHYSVIDHTNIMYDPCVVVGV